MSTKTDADALITQTENEGNRIIAELERILQHAEELNLEPFRNSDFSQLIDLEIEDNLEPSQNNTHSLSITNSCIQITDSDLNTETIELTDQGNNMYGQAIASYRGYFYSIGGSTLSGQTSKLVSVYASNGEVKRSAALLSKKRKFSACVEINRNLFIIGGQKHKGAGINKIEVINLENFQNTYHQLDLSIGRRFPSVCVFNDFLYVASSENRVIEKFDPENLGLKTKFEVEEVENVYFIAQVDKYLVAFGEGGYAFFDVKDRVCKFVRKEVEVMQWSQSGCGVSEDEVFFKDYFSGEVRRISLELP